jgi:hypothetical protein
MALKPKKKSLEIDIFSEAEVAQDRMAVEPRDETRGPPLSPLGKWHAGVDMEKLPAMSDEECELFDKLRQRGTYVVVIRRGKKYYLDGEQVGVDPIGKQLKTKLVEGLIKKDWLHASVSQDREAYFVTSHMVFAWRKRLGI